MAQIGGFAFFAFFICGMLAKVFKNKMFDIEFINETQKIKKKIQISEMRGIEKRLEGPLNKLQLWQILNLTKL